MRKTHKFLNVVIIILLIILMLSFYSNTIEYFNDDDSYSIKLNKLLSIKDYERNKRLEAQLQDDFERIVPGLGNKGAAVTLVGKSYSRGELDMVSNGLNIECSKHISFNRTLDDTRTEKCRNIAYNINSLPTASVVIIFHNEVFSVLLRTIHSILRTSPQNLLKDIIVVDDFSSIDETKDKLEYYIQTRLPRKVKLLRLPERYKYKFCSLFLLW